MYNVLREEATAAGCTSLENSNESDESCRGDVGDGAIDYGSTRGDGRGWDGAEACNPPHYTRHPGSPRGSADRSQPSNVLIVNGKPYLIDAGNGVAGQLLRAGVPFTMPIGAR